MKLPDGCKLWNSPWNGQDAWTLATRNPDVVGEGPAPESAIASAIVELRALSARALDMADRLREGLRDGST
jgi:hypothetical protein